MAAEDLSKLKIDKSQAPHLFRRGRAFYRVGSVLLIALVALFFFKGVFSPAVQVEIATVTQVYPSRTFTLLNASGYVVAQRKASVSSKATGSLESLYVEEGSRVQKNMIMARLESRDVVAARDQAAANLNLARSNVAQAKAELSDATLAYNRAKELVAKGFIAKADFDTAEARYQKAVAGVAASEAAVKANVAALRAAEVAIEYTLIRAPFDAVVLTKNADVGDIITPFGAAANAKASVVTIADMNSLQVEADVSESDLEQVKVGQPCEIQLDALPESRFRGEVHMIVPTADRSKATVMVKVRFLDKDPRILPEMSAKVAFLQRPVAADERRPRTAISPMAIVSRSGKKAVLLIRDGRAVETPVTLGPEIGDMVEVYSGVKAGEKVVLKPLGKVESGDKVKVAEK